MIYYVIPARKGSKGLPYKNRLLFCDTANTVKDYGKNVIVSTDDEEIMVMAERYGFTIRERLAVFAQDNTKIKTVLHDILNSFRMEGDDIIVMLYLTYPERTLQNIQDAIHFFEMNNGKSMLCKKEWKYVHPCLCMYDMGNNKGQPLFYHSFYRRQDYPKVFQVSHFIVIFKVYEFNKLNNQLYNENTIFMPIEDYIDVDSQSDYDKFITRS